MVASFLEVCIFLRHCDEFVFAFNAANGKALKDERDFVCVSWETIGSMEINHESPYADMGVSADNNRRPWNGLLRHSQNAA